SCFSGRSVVGGTLSWHVEMPVTGQQHSDTRYPNPDTPLAGEEPVRLSFGLDAEPTYGSYAIAQVWITAPSVPTATKGVIHLTLRDAEGDVVGRSTQNIVFVPANRRAIGRGKTVWLHDPLGSAIGLSSLLTGVGCRVVTQPEPGATGLVTRWDPVVSAFLHG